MSPPSVSEAVKAVIADVLSHCKEEAPELYDDLVPFRDIAIFDSLVAEDVTGEIGRRLGMEDIQNPFKDPETARLLNVAEAIANVSAQLHAHGRGQ